MPDKRWARLKTLFRQAVELPADRRGAFMSACPDDPALREQLEALVASADASSTFLETPTDGFHTPDASLDGTVLDGKYRLDELLGEGGMGVVYRATHLALNRFCAVKLIKATEAANPTFLEQFELEAATLGKLRHQGVVSVTDYGVDTRNGAVPYLVMEYLEGETLAAHCEARGPLGVTEALPILQAIAAAIDYAHHQGVLHRDLKPANVFLARDASGADRVKIVDFGLARFTEVARAVALRGTHGDGPRDGDTVTQVQAGASPRIIQAGTPAYMAPELTRGEDPTTASDIYAFGVMAFEMLMGHTPFQGSALEILNAHRDAGPPLPSNILAGFASDLDAPLLAPLAKHPDARPRHTLDFVHELRRVSRAVDVGRWRARERPRRLGASLAAGAAVLVSPMFSIVGPIAHLENRLVDVRAQFAIGRPPDSRILLISIDDVTLAADPTPLPNRADEFGRTLTNLRRAGARGIALDLMLPPSWSQSPAFSRFILESADRLTLAALSAPSGAVIGPESITGLTTAALGPARASSLFGFVNSDADADGVTRHGRIWFVDRSGETRDTLAGRANRLLASRSVPGPTDPSRFWIDPALDSTRFDRLSWKDVAATVARTPEVFHDRLILVGSEYLGSGDERHPVVHRRGAPDAVSGLVLQALLVNTISDGFPVRERGRVLFACGVATFTCGAAWLVLWRPKFSRGLFAFGACMAAALAAAFVLFRQALVLLPIAGPTLFAGIALVATLLLRRRLPPVPAADGESA